MTYYFITVPIPQSRLKEIGDALMDNVMSYFCIPGYIIMDEDSTFLSSLMKYLLKKFNINLKL